MKNGHGCVFEWKGQHYALLENNDIGYFCRGMSLKPLSFTDEGAVIVPGDNEKYPGRGRTWNFEHAAIGWQPVEGTTLKWDKARGTIRVKSREMPYFNPISG